MECWISPQKSTLGSGAIGWLHPVTDVAEIACLPRATDGPTIEWVVVLIDPADREKAPILFRGDQSEAEHQFRVIMDGIRRGDRIIEIVVHPKAQWDKFEAKPEGLEIHSTDDTVQHVEGIEANLAQLDPRYREILGQKKFSTRPNPDPVH